MRRSIELDSSSAAAYDTLGEILKKKGLVDEAIEAYTKALELDPTFGESHQNLVTTLIEQKRYDEALTAINKCLESEPINPEALKLRKKINQKNK